MKFISLNSFFVMAFLFTGLTDFVLPASAQSGLPLWTNYYNGPANGNDYLTGIATDGTNAFVTGYSQNSSGIYETATIKYTSAGVPLWTKRYSVAGDQSDQGRAIAVDRNGNVFITGLSANSSGEQFYETIKYSPAGVALWINRFDPLGYGSVASAIAVDNSDNVFVTGYSSDTNRVVHFATIKYSGAGASLWTNFYIGPGNRTDAPDAIAVDGNGDVFVTGHSEPAGPTAFDYVIIKYSSDGVPLWTNRYNGAAIYNWPTAMAVDSNGNVFVTGRSGASSLFGIPTNHYATIAYSGAGVPLWTNRYSGPGNGDDEARGLAVDGNGNVFVTGLSWNGAHNDYATIKYSGAGVPLWTNRYHALQNADANATAVAVDNSGNVFVTGGSYANPPFGATIAYSNAGSPLWTNRCDGDLAIAVDGSGNVFVAGDGGNGGYVTIKYSSSILPPHLGFQAMSHQLVLNWTNAGFILQSAPDLTATFTNIPNATSPFTNPVTAPQQFFRLISH